MRLRGAGATTEEIGSGEFIIDFAIPEPTPPPVTTIAWRLSHLLVGVFGARLASHFGGSAVDYFSYDYPGTANDALSRLDDMYLAWIEGVRSLSEDELTRPCGEHGFDTAPMAAWVLHIHREVIHHGAEICLCVICSPGRAESPGDHVIGGVSAVETFRTLAVVGVTPAPRSQRPIPAPDPSTLLRDLPPSPGAPGHESPSARSLHWFARVP